MRKYRELILNDISYQLELSDEFGQIEVSILKNDKRYAIIEEVVIYDTEKCKFYTYEIEKDEAILSRDDEWLNILKKNGILGECMWVDDEYNYICHKVNLNQFK